MNRDQKKSSETSRESATPASARIIEPEDQVSNPNSISKLAKREVLQNGINLEPTTSSSSVNKEREPPQSNMNQALTDLPLTASGQEPHYSHESPEDATLRREMLQYNMQDVGAVVAQIDLDDEDELDPRDDQEYDLDLSDHSYDLDTDDEDEIEDEHGRTVTRVLDDAYIAQMRKLEAKLQATAMFNTGQRENLAPEESNCSNDSSDGKQPLTASAITQTASAKPSKKGVRFTEELDIQEAPANDSSVFEKGTARTSATVKQPIAPEAPSGKKVSQFKASRANTAASQASATISQHPASLRSSELHPPKIHADTIVERPVNLDDAPQHRRPFSASAPDDFDAAILNQEMRTEYHRLRARQIQREGGFMPRDEEKAEVALTEEEGGPKKISRFKAARLGRGS